MLTVLEIAYPLAPVGPDAVGGAEQILSALDAALVAAGHRSIVIACEGSVVRGELVALPPPPESLTSDAWVNAHAACRTAIRDVLAREHVDVVHMHGIDFHAYLPPAGPSVLVTLHLPLDWYPREVFAPRRPRTFLHCVSRAQHMTAPREARLLDEIENGVDLDRLRPSDIHGGYAIALGRICPEKGQHVALDAATLAGVPLVLAGRVFPFREHEAYFRDEITPRLRAPHRFIGPVAGEDKWHLIASAACAVVPSLVPETSSLVAMEALACGTPVVAFRRGALVDLIDDGITGYLAEDAGELAEMLGRVDLLDRSACRVAAEERCSQRRMCERYLARYDELAQRPRPQPALRAEVLDRASLAAIESQWSELWERAANATVFQRPEWCMTWCEHLLDGVVESIAIWRGSALHAVLPLFRWRDGDASVLSLIGAGVSDYSDLVTDDPGVLPVVEHALRALAWDRLELSELPESSPLLTLALSSTDEVAEQGPCPGLAVEAAVPLGAIPSALRRDIAYQRRRAAREVGLEEIRLQPCESIDALARLHQARWAKRGEPGLLDDRRTRFLRAAAEKLAPSGVVLGTGIRVGGELAAVALTLLDRGRARYYLGGFAPVHERRSPGTLAIAAAIEQAAARGVTLFDFLRGREAYKYRFGARDRVQLRRRIVHRS